MIISELEIEGLFWIKADPILIIEENFPEYFAKMFYWNMILNLILNKLTFRKTDLNIQCADFIIRNLHFGNQKLLRVSPVLFTM